MVRLFLIAFTEVPDLGGVCFFVPEKPPRKSVDREPHAYFLHSEGS
jgi:hypothetical protein